MVVRAPIGAAAVIAADPVVVQHAINKLSSVGIVLHEQPDAAVERLQVFVALARRPDRALAAIAAAGLSPRQVEVLELMAEGLTNREIGQRLYLSAASVKTHAAILFRRLGVDSRETAVMAGLRLGILGGA